MPELNEQLTTIARDVIREMREEGWDDEDIKWSASGGILKHLEREDPDFEPSKENLAAIVALVKQCLKEDTIRQDFEAFKRQARMDAYHADDN